MSTGLKVTTHQVTPEVVQESYRTLPVLKKGHVLPTQPMVFWSKGATTVVNAWISLCAWEGAWNYQRFSDMQDVFAQKFPFSPENNGEIIKGLNDLVKHGWLLRRVISDVVYYCAAPETVEEFFDGYLERSKVSE